MDQAGFEPSFPQRACSLVVGVEVAHIPAAQVLHHPGDAIFFQRRRQQVDMIGHEDPGMYLHTKPARGLLQPLRISRKIYL